MILDVCYSRSTVGFFNASITDENGEREKTKTMEEKEEGKKVLMQNLRRFITFPICGEAAAALAAVGFSVRRPENGKRMSKPERA